MSYKNFPAPTGQPVSAQGIALGWGVVIPEPCRGDLVLPVTLRSPLQGSDSLRGRDLGRCPRLTQDAPIGAKNETSIFTKLVARMNKLRSRTPKIANLRYAVPVATVLFSSCKKSEQVKAPLENNKPDQVVATKSEMLVIRPSNNEFLDIDLKEFEGFIDYGSPIDASESGEKIIITESRIEMPVFKTNSKSEALQIKEFEENESLQPSDDPESQ